MKEYSIGYQELLDFPFEKYLEFSQILSIEAREEKKKTEQKQKEMESNV